MFLVVIFWFFSEVNLTRKNDGLRKKSREVILGQPRSNWQFWSWQFENWIGSQQAIIARIWIFRRPWNDLEWPHVTLADICDLVLFKGKILEENSTFLIKTEIRKGTIFEKCFRKINSQRIDSKPFLVCYHFRQLLVPFWKLELQNFSFN